MKRIFTVIAVLALITYTLPSAALASHSTIDSDTWAAYQLEGDPGGDSGGGDSGGGDSGGGDLGGDPGGGDPG